MRRVLLALVGAALAAPAPAAAATFGEAPYLSVRGDAECARGTGTLDELAIPTLNGMRFLQATTDGLRSGPEVRIGAGFECGAVATRPGGAGVIAGKIHSQDVVVVIREPAGTWGAPQVIDTGRVDEVHASVSDRGDVIVAFKEEVDEEHQRLRVLRRTAGRALSPVVTVGPTSAQLARVDVKVAANGEAFVLWSTITGTKAPLRVPVEVAIAPPDGAFGAPVRIGDARLSPPALAVAPDGRALVASSDGTSLQVSERAPGAGFGAPVALGAAADPLLTAIDAQLGPNGEAVVAWARSQAGTVEVITRVGAGAFSAPVTVLRGWRVIPPGYDLFYASESFFATLAGSGGITFDEGFGRLVTLTGDGRAMTTLASNEGIHLATFPLAGGVVDAQVLPGDGTGAMPLRLADGTPAVAWAEGSWGGSFRLHFASAATVERADPPLPRVTVGAPVRRVVTEERELRLPITCDGPCEVTLTEERVGVLASARVRRSRAGTSVVSLPGAYFAASSRTGPVRFRLAYRAPGALHPSTRTVIVRIRRGGAPDARVTGLTAVRQGDRIRVRFRVTGATEEFGVFVSGEDAREWNGEPLVTRVAEGSKRSYELSLPAAGVKYVVVRVPFLFFPGQRVIARVR